MRKLLIGLLIAGLVILIVVVAKSCGDSTNLKETTPQGSADNLWHAPDTAGIPSTEEGDLVRYGRQLIIHTAAYLGPQGSVAHISNGMNCQNCHLEAGTKPWGNNYAAVASAYPKYRDRSGSIETIEKRINDCLERSLGGKALDSNSKELRAIVAYMHWLGQGLAKNTKPPGAGIAELNFLNRAADTAKGKLVYIQKCQTCHGANGAGTPDSSGKGYLYPPLWGNNSYNVGAGLFRLTRFAGYVRDNMPFGATYGKTQLKDEEAWDVAAYVNSKPRPFKDLSMDWPKMSTKPLDHPFGPYTDSFSEYQHKYGPFQAIKEYKAKTLAKK